MPMHQRTEAWQNEPPYAATAQSQSDFRNAILAKCHCGKVEFDVKDLKPLASKFCHCDTCKSVHGAPFQWAAIIQKTDMKLRTGAEYLHMYNSGSKSSGHMLPCKISCSYCSTLIMDEGRNMVMLFPTVLQFENDTQKVNFEADCHIFYSQRVVDIVDGKPKWSGLDQKSDLINDS